MDGVLSGVVSSSLVGVRGGLLSSLATELLYGCLRSSLIPFNELVGDCLYYFTFLYTEMS